MCRIVQGERGVAALCAHSSPGDLKVMFPQKTKDHRRLDAILQTLLCPQIPNILLLHNTKEKKISYQSQMECSRVLDFFNTEGGGEPSFECAPL